MSEGTAPGQRPGQGLGIEVVASPVISYAMAHCGLPFLHRVVVDPPRGAAARDTLEDVVVSAAVVDAEGTVLTRPWLQQVEAMRGDVPLVIDTPAVRLDPQAVAQLDEETTAEIVVTVTVGANGVAGQGDPVTTHTPVRVLAARQWTIDPAAPILSLELLAAFVQPNHPAVGGLVSRAATLLEQRTKSGSLAATDASPERRDAIVEAVFDAVFELDVHYAEPPASWGYGQKVRSPGDVVTDRLGTCLDTTLTLAACLEQIGITPVVWIARGHAFLGWWRASELGLADAASLEVAAASNAVDLRRMGVVETTMVTRERRPPKDLFRRATQAPLDSFFLQRGSDLVGVVDIGMARLLRILPVPARRVRDDGVVEVVEYVPAGDSGSPYAAPASTSTSTATPADGRSRDHRPPPPPRVQAWKNALLDLTLRNKLLNLSPPMTQAPLITPSEQLGLLARLLQEGRTISVRAVDDLAGAISAEGHRDAYALPGDVQRSMLAQRATIFSGYEGDVHKAAMQRLRYRARTTLQETGANPLYVTLGRFDWRLGDRELSAPLLLAPVEIKGVVTPFRIAFDESGGVTLNHSLLEKLRLEYGFTVDGLSSRDDLPTLPDSDHVDVDAVVTRVREAIAASGLPFRVESEARLAIIAFTGYLLWRDLDDHWETFLQRPLVRHLALTPTDSYSGGEAPALEGIDLDEVTASSPVTTDGAQAEAVAAARAGASFVLEGPPGTGKSQTITGIIADQMSRGRTVLFVAEKGAALDVVRNRLGEVGLLPFALDLHDENARPVEVRARLRTALGSTATPDTDGYRMAAQDVATAGSVLESYAGRLHARNAAGLGLYTAYTQRLARGDEPALRVPTSVVGADVDLESVRRVVAAAVPALAALGADPTPAWGFAREVPVDLDALWTALDAVDAVLVPDEASPDPALATALRAEGLDDLESVTWLLSGDATPVAALVESRSPRWQSALDELRERSGTVRAGAADVLALLAPEVFEVEVEPVRQALREASASFFVGRRKRVVAAAAPVLAHLRPGADVDPKALPALVDRVADVGQRAREVVGSWRTLPGCAGLPADTLLLTDRGWAAVTGAVDAVLRDRGLLDALPTTLAQELTTAAAGGGRLSGSTRARLVDTARALRDVIDRTGGDPASTRAFGRGAGLLGAWRQGLDTRRADRPRAAALRRWVAATEALTPLESVLPETHWDLLTGRVPADVAPEALDRGLARAAYDERWDSGGFDSFDTERQDRTVARFVDASGLLRSHLSSALPAALLERRPFRPGAFFGTVGQLEREIGRTRGGLSVRRLVQQYGEVIKAITPCVLVSPDSLARFIPPGSMTFDLVVFDEASQITVADAIGALGRADAAIIAGDSKQMPPSSFGQLSDPSLEEDAEQADADFQVVPDEESILGEAVHAGVGRLWLSWHYRSQDESLIAFSNAAYYDDRLSSFPAHPAQVHDTGITFTRVPGQFLRSRRKGQAPQDAPALVPDAIAATGERGLLRTNPVEAAAVVAEVLRRWAGRERSIGVVTFNIQQRALIEQMLWDSGVEGIAESLALKQDGLFVKNLENVQGDERDVILFSTGFSANADGVLPLNFGPLNRSGGERRLNVAVTRARRRVMVFSSFEPEDLRVAETSSVGIRDLRRYLEVAKHGVAATLGTATRVDGSQPAAGAEAGPRATAVRAAVARGGVDRHRDEVAEALRAAGLEVQTALGLSDFQVDLAAGPPGRGPSLAVLLDSPAWASRRTVSDRDGLPTTVLERVMGWPAVARVWLPSWVEDRDAVVAHLVALAHEAADRPRVVGERVAVTTRGPVQDAATAGAGDRDRARARAAGRPGGGRGPRPRRRRVGGGARPGRARRVGGAAGRAVRAVGQRRRGRPRRARQPHHAAADRPDPGAHARGRRGRGADQRRPARQARGRRARALARHRRPHRPARPGGAGRPAARSRRGVRLARPSRPVAVEGFPPLRRRPQGPPARRGRAARAGQRARRRHRGRHGHRRRRAAQGDLPALRGRPAAHRRQGAAARRARHRRPRRPGGRHRRRRRPPLTPPTPLTRRPGNAGRPIRSVGRVRGCVDPSPRR